MASTFSKHSVSSELAHRLIEAAERRATQMGQAFVIAIVDESGVLKALSRMDGAPLLSVQVAQDKAYTAVGFGGGFPLKVDGQLVGGIGVSGGHYSQDMEVARAALSVLEG